MPPHFAAVYRWLVVSHHLALPTEAQWLLDVGTDDGFIASRIPSHRRVGVDLAPRIGAGASLQVARASAEQLPLVSDRFDCVLAFDILEHLADDASAMREMLRVLAPHGTLWFSVPAREFRLVPGFLTPRANRAFGHERNGYLPDEVAALIGDAGPWSVELCHWNEPAFRLAFVPLHFVQLVWPALAGRLAGLCYRLDRRFPVGERGHILGSVRRRAGAGGV
jgi:SAM-dependent methyltransferase